MNCKIEVRPLAMIEMAEGFDSYESQREGPGYEFLESVDQFIAGLISNPFTHSFFEEPVDRGQWAAFDTALFMKLLAQQLLSTVYL